MPKALKQLAQQTASIVFCSFQTRMGIPRHIRGPQAFRSKCLGLESRLNTLLMFLQCQSSVLVRYGTFFSKDCLFSGCTQSRGYFIEFDTSALISIQALDLDFRQKIVSFFQGNSRHDFDTRPLISYTYLDLNTGFHYQAKFKQPP